MLDTYRFYVNCSALAIDIRGSSKLTNEHTRPVLAKIYRSYISEVVAVMNGDINCKEIMIVGDGITGIFNTPRQADINRVFSTAAELSSVINLLNWRLEKKGYMTIKVGIGMDYGRALMIKAGYKGSGINDVVWMGDVLNSSTKLCSYGNRTYADERLMVSTIFFNNLNEYNQSLLKWNYNRLCYHGYVVNIAMDEDLNDKKAKNNSVKW